MLDIRIWIAADHHAAFRAGGWAFVLAEGRALSGAAGGERTTSAERIALAGVTEALKGAPAGAVVTVHSASPLVVGIPRRIADTDNPPTEDLDLWPPIVAALQGRTVRFVAAANQPRTPTAFAAAWAELARDKAKNAGAFRATIPKPNLAKAGVPA